MKKIVAIVALLGILLQTFSQVVILAEYYANKDFIAANLCENKDKPELHCEGKCCLKRKLANESKKQVPSPQSQRSKQTVILFFAELYNPVPIRNTIVADVDFFNSNNMHTSSYHAAVFHPPSA